MPAISEVVTRTNIAVRDATLYPNAMKELARAASDLVEVASSGVTGRALRSAVAATLDAYREAAPAEVRTAIRTIGKALPGAKSSAVQVLSLALGALVEAGAPPDLAWTAIEGELLVALERATAFAQACMAKARDAHVDAAIEAAGKKVAAKDPEGAAALETLPARALGAVACVCRSKKLRARLREDTTVLEAAWPLSDLSDELGSLVQVLRMVDGESLIAIHPDSCRGWRLEVDEVTSNVELYVLIAAALVGDPKKELLRGKAPDGRMLQALRAEAAPKKMPAYAAPFHLVSWTALSDDGALPPATVVDHGHWIDVDGTPSDIPLFGEERIVLLQTPPSPQEIAIHPTFDGLRPDVRVKSALSAREVEKRLVTMGTKAARVRAATPAKKKTTKKEKAHSHSHAK